MSRFAIIDCEQHSPEWLAARAGRATGSRADAILAKGKGNAEAVTRLNYRIQLVAERLTGKPQEDDFQSRDMQKGTEREPYARAAHEARTGLLVRETGFLAMSEILAGCSLDGDIENFKGLVSYKCPKPATHVKYLKEARLPPEYCRQATHEMWVTGAEFYEFVSYCESLPDYLQLFTVRVHRNEFDIEGYERELLKFLAEVDSEVEALKKLRTAA
jgi:hypothetical protein